MIFCGVIQSAAGGYDADAQAFFTAAGITDSGQKTAINTLVLALKSAGVWAKCIALYPFVGGTATPHRYNLINPATFLITFSGGITHSSTGADWNGSNGYADTGINPFSDLNKEDLHISYYSREDNADTFSMGIGDEDGSPLLSLWLKRAGNTTGFDDGDGLTSDRMTASNSNAQGFFIGTTRSSTDRAINKNGSNIGTSSTALTSVTLSNSAHLCIGGWYSTFTGNAAYFTANECALASIGSGLTNTEMSDFYTAVQAYQTSLSRQV